MKSSIRTRLFMLPVTAGLATFALAESAVSQDALVVGADTAAHPYIIASPDGGLTGFNIDLATEVAKRLGRGKLDVVSQPFAALFAGLEAKKYEFIIAPVTVTQQRSEAMLFIEGYIATDLQFIIKDGDKPILSLDDLNGKSISVNNGSAQEQYLQSIQNKYSFTLSKYATNADAFQAVLSGREDIAMGSDGNVMYAAAQNPRFHADYVVKTGNVMSWAFRKDDEENRTRVEHVVECMKLDGTVARIYEKWFGMAPAADSPSTTVYAGVGQPGKANFLNVFSAPTCPTN